VTATIAYALSTDVWSDYSNLIRELAQAPEVVRVCELGGGANPLLSLEFIAQQGLDHVIIDISSEELRKTPQGYRKIQADVAAAGLDPGPPFDLVFSRLLVEHVRDPAALHRNVHGMLAPGGRAAHFFPTLYALPFVLNRCLPEALTEPLLVRIQPDRHRGGTQEKFHAYYRWCRGPTRRQIERFTATGFEVERYVGYFGHSYYRGIRPLHAVQDRIARQLIRWPVPALTSFAIVVLRKPRAAHGIGDGPSTSCCSEDRWRSSRPARHPRTGCPSA
jgi:SAM-dependent methyltransferase